MIEIRELTKRYGAHTVFSDLNLTLAEPGITCLHGPSGCGKTTLLRLILGLELPDGGELTGVPERIACVFQEDRLLPWRTAERNVAVAARDRGSRSRARELLAELGLSEASALYPDELSGGMQRRVALARAACTASELLILDEPFKGLDDAARETAMAFVKRHFASVPTLYVTHDLAEAETFADRMLDLGGFLPAPPEGR